MAYWKKIKNTNAVAVLKDDLVFDQTPTVNSTNPVTSDGVARAIAGASGEVPVVTENDNGKVLTAIYDEGGAAVEWASAPNEVPAVGENDNAKVLTATYSEGTGSFAWSAAPTELPDTTGASQGDVLSIGSSGLEWATPSGGSGVPEYSASDEGKVLSVVTEGVEETPALGWVEPPAGSVVIEYNGSHTYTSEECAALVAQVSAAITARKPVFVCDVSSGSQYPRRYALLSYTGRNASYSTEYRFVMPSASTTASLYSIEGESQNGAVYKLSTSSFTYEGANIRSLPTTNSGTRGKVLGVTDNNGTLAWVDEQDTKYTAGDGIEIDAQNAVSVNVGTGLSINSDSTVDMTLQAIKRDDRYCSIGLLTAQAVAAIKGNASLAVTVLSDYKFSPPAYYSFNDVRIAIVPGIDAGRLPDVSAAKAILSTTNIRSSYVAGSGTNLYTMSANTQVTVDFSNPTIGSNISWTDVEANPTNYLLAIVGNYYGTLYGGTDSYSEAAGSDPEQKDVATIGYTVPGDHSLNVSNPVPTYAVGDANKVLTVNAGGTGVEWQNVPQELPASLGTAGQVLTVNSGATGVEWAAAPGTTYSTGSGASTSITIDNSVVSMLVDPTNLTINAGVRQAVVQWTVASVTTLPTITAGTGNSYTYKANANNPSSLTVGKTYQLSILNDCYTVVEFG